MKRAGVAVFIALAAVAVPSAQGSQTSIKVVGFAKIGAFQVRGSGPASARRTFGKPTGQKETTGDCTVTWPGVRISFYTLFHTRQCRDWSSFGEAWISRPWVTERGLRQGDPVSKAKQLYPDARRPGRNLGLKSGVGLLIKFSQAIGDYGLAAEVKNGRVTTLWIEDPQGGE